MSCKIRRTCIEHFCEQRFSDSSRRAAQKSQRVKRHKFSRWLAKEMAPELRQLLARLGESTISHLQNARSVVQGVAAFPRCLVDAPDCLALMDVAGDDLRRAEGAVRLAGHEEPCHRQGHW